MLPVPPLRRRPWPGHHWLVAGALAAAGCGGVEDPRTAEIASVIARADEPLLRTRPGLVAGKYAMMAAAPYAFFRGTVPLFLHDFAANREGLAASRFALATPLVLSLGDAHVENFGALIAADGSHGLEPNDFDGADRTVYLWDVRRLAIAMALGARLSNTEDAVARSAAVGAAREIAFAAALSYAGEMRALAGGAAGKRADDPEGSPVLEDLFERSRRDTDSRAELDDFTRVEGAARRLLRGIVEPEEPTHVFRSLPPAALDALPAALAAYRTTLVAPPPAEFFQIRDAVRELGSGVASFPRVRALVLVRGPTDSPDDDVLLEAKELPDAGTIPHPPPEVWYDTATDRVRRTSRAAWATPAAAPLWGTTELLGFQCQVRLESAGQKTLRVARLEKEEGTVAALVDLASRLGALLARVHATPLFAGEPSPAPQIAAAIGEEVEAFAAEQADVAEGQSAGVLDDFARFGDALTTLGPTLGVPDDPSDAPGPDLAALYDGVPSEQ